MEPARTPRETEHVELPANTIWPLVLALGVIFLAAGLATSSWFLIVGGALFAVSLAGWILLLLPGRGHIHELVDPALLTPPAITPRPGTIDSIRPGTLGYRLRLPERVHPISAGVKGGVVGGLLMPIPALIYGVASGRGLWFPVNLLAGMVLPGVDQMTAAQLSQFSLLYLVIGIIIHAVTSLVIGLMYGVLLPTLPQFRGSQLIWGGLLLPLLWTGASFSLMRVINPALNQHVEWFWFVVSQFVYGVAAAIVVIRSEKVYIPPAGAGPEVDDENAWPQ